MESRLANIVHHISGEADEDTMSAWESLNGGGGVGAGGLGSPSEMGPAFSLRRRSSFGQQMASFSEDPLVGLGSDQGSLDAELADVGRGGIEIDEMKPTIGGAIQRANEVVRVEKREDASEVVRVEKREDASAGVAAGTAGGVPIDGGDKGDTKKAQVGDKPAAIGVSAAINTKPNDTNTAEPSPAAMPSEGEKRRMGSAEAPSDALVRNLATDEQAREMSVEATTAATEKIPDKLLVVGGGGGNGGNGMNDANKRRRSNQDDQSDGSNSKINSARDSSISGGSFRGEGVGQGEESVDFPLSTSNLQGSIESSESDARCFGDATRRTV